MVKRSTCQAVFNFHCQHWGLSEAAHALVHAQVRRQQAVYDEDMAAGHGFGKGSESSVSEDGPWLERLLLDEGYRVVPL